MCPNTPGTPWAATARHRTPGHPLLAWTSVAGTELQAPGLRSSDAGEGRCPWTADNGGLLAWRRSESWTTELRPRRQLPEITTHRLELVQLHPIQRMIGLRGLHLQQFVN
jgi:hypothetical protein